MVSYVVVEAVVYQVIRKESGENKIGSERVFETSDRSAAEEIARMLNESGWRTVTLPSA